MSDTINNKFEQFKTLESTQEFFKGVPEYLKDNLLNVIGFLDNLNLDDNNNPDLLLQQNNHLDISTYNFVDKFRKTDLEFNHDYIGSTCGHFRTDCFLHYNMPVKIDEIILDPRESIVDKVSAAKLSSFPVISIYNNDDPDTDDDIPQSEKKEIFELASKKYSGNWLRGYKIPDSKVSIDHNGYSAHFDLMEFTRGNGLIFSGGKATPKDFYIHNPGKTIDGLKAKLEEIQTTIKDFIGKQYPCLEGDGSSYISPETQAENSLSKAICNTDNKRLNGAITIGKPKKEGVTIEQNIILFYKIIIGKIVYKVIMPNGKPLTQEVFEEYVKEAITRKVESIVQQTQNEIISLYGSYSQ